MCDHLDDYPNSSKATRSHWAVDWVLILQMIKTCAYNADQAPWYYRAVDFTLKPIANHSLRKNWTREAYNFIH